MNTVEVKESAIEGLGVFARVDIPAGETVLIIDDSRVVTDDDPLRSEEGEFERHCDWFPDRKVVLMQPPERYINHSCDPNTYTKTTDGVRVVIARRDIKSGEEITYDYCVNGFGNAVWECNCGARRCRSKIHADFFHLPLEFQVEYLPLLDEWYVKAYRDRVEDLRRKIEGREVGDDQSGAGEAS